ncbi:S9 family peptidase [Bacteroides sp. OttesenSCG-928-D19]|nr:S9 family peptidase [Bacteroides sp. OttesenSCG-928-N06]MDL2304515.1 S9 family peptidase [Bacteroides sp. OttesenSCG-928-D19]
MTAGVAMSQPTPTLEELIPGGSKYRFAENIYGLQWWGDVCIKPTIDKVLAIDPASGKETELFTLSQVNEVLEKQEISKLNHLYSIKFLWPNAPRVLISKPGKYIVYDFGQHCITHTREMQDMAANADYEHHSGNVAYTIKNNLYVNNDAVTAEPEGIVCGQSVHRNEFGINKGTFWSPEGNLLAFYRMDESMVAQYPLVDTGARIAEVNNIRYPMAGMTSHKVTVGIYNVANRETIFLDLGDTTDRYFTNISWSPDAKSIYLIELNRDQNHAKLCQYNAVTGQLVKVLFEETHAKYVEPLQAIAFLPWNDTQFIYQSRRDGFNHIYLYNTDGQLLKQLTQGNWEVRNVVGFDKRRKELLISSTEVLPIQSNLFKVNIATSKRTPVDNAEGMHHAQLSQSGRYIIDSYSSPTTPRTIEVTDTQKKKNITLLTAQNPFEGYKLPAIETGTIKAADGVTDLYYRLVKPVDFDETRRYPTIIYVYGGPHSQMVNNSWQYGVRGWDIYMATLGYVMFTIDNRGTSYRGLEFENCTFRRLGIEECKDQVEGVKFLQSLPYVDANRIGVHGWSYGGHMTTALMLRQPDLFKVGVAGGPVIDWKYYEIMYGERYMDSPQTNAEGYEETNLKNMAGNLKGHLLIIHDDHDDTCVPQHTLSFMKACVDARTYPDLFIYPGHKHNVMGRDRVHLHQKITTYFEDYLK